MKDLLLSQEYQQGDRNYIKDPNENLVERLKSKTEMAEENQ